MSHRARKHAAAVLAVAMTVQSTAGSAHIAGLGQFQPRLSQKIAAATGHSDETVTALIDRSDLTSTPREPGGVANAEKLIIKFHGYADLSGEYRVGVDRSISIPVIGRVSVDHMDVATLEERLSDRAAKVAGRDVYVAVEISEYRPIYVTGFVSKPGAMPWRPGMNVLQAMALSGGIYRANGTEMGQVGPEGEVITLRKAISDQKRNLAALARLEAERQGRSAIDVPAKLKALVGEAEARDLIAAQTSALVSRNAAVEAKQAALARAMDMAKQELKVLGDTERRSKTQLTTRRDYKSKIDKLQSKGIVRVERSIDEFTRVSDLEDRVSNTEISIARVRGQLAGMEREAVNLHQERRANIDADIINLQREIAKLDIDIDTSRSNYRRLTGQEPPADLLAADGQHKPQQSLKYQIISSAGSARSARPDQLSSLQPGDILVVSVE